MSLDLLLNQLQANAIDYKALAKHSITFLSSAERDVNVFIGCKGRAEYLRTTLRYLNAAITAQSTHTYRITVIEHDKVSNLSRIAQGAGCNYIWLNANVTKTGEEFSRALAFNCGYLWANKSEWLLLHDSDVLIPRDGLAKLSKYMTPTAQFIQPYSKRVMHRLRQPATDRIMSSAELFDLDAETDWECLTPGATGGSLLVRSSAFQAVGGFDDHIFVGWAAEDQMLWTKLECLRGEIPTTSTCHRNSGAVYANDINMYHLEHGKELWKYDSVWRKMQDYYEGFCSLNYNDKLHYLDSRADILRDTQ